MHSLFPAYVVSPLPIHGTNIQWLVELASPSLHLSCFSCIPSTYAPTRYEKVHIRWHALDIVMTGTGS